MKLQRAEIVRIKLPEKLVARYQIATLKRQVYAAYCYLLDRFIKEDFDIFVAQFRAAIDPPPSGSTANADGSTTACLRLLAELTVHHPNSDEAVSRTQRRVSECKPIVELGLAANLHKMLLTQHSRPIGYPDKDLHQSLVLAYFRDLEHHWTTTQLLSGTRQIAFHGSPEFYPELEKLLPSGVVLHHVAYSADLPVINPEIEPLCVIMMEPDLPQRTVDAIASRSLMLRSGTVGKLLATDTGNQTAVCVQLLQIDTDSITLTNDEARRGTYIQQALDKLLLDRQIDVAMFRDRIIVEFNWAIAVLANRLANHSPS